MYNPYQNFQSLSAPAQPWLYNPQQPQAVPMYQPYAPTAQQQQPWGMQQQQQPPMFQNPYGNAGGYGGMLRSIAPVSNNDFFEMPSSSYSSGYSAAADTGDFMEMPAPRAPPPTPNPSTEIEVEEEKQTAPKPARKLAVIDEVYEDEKGVKSINLLGGKSIPLPPDISREALRAQQKSQRLRLEKWNGVIPYDTSKMCFFFRNLIQWGLLNQPVKVIENRPVFDEHFVKLEEQLSKQHPEFKVCPNPAHARIWEYYPCVGVSTVNTKVEMDDCDICPKNTVLNNLFHRRALELVEAAAGKDPKALYKAAYKKFQKVYNEQDENSPLRATYRKDMQQAFFVYTVRVWDLGLKCRTAKAVTDAEREVFEDFIDDFNELRDRPGPFMYCEVHQAVGDAIPWMRQEDYKDCMICMSETRRDMDRQAYGNFTQGIESTGKAGGEKYKQASLQPYVGVRETSSEEEQQPSGEEEKKMDTESTPVAPNPLIF